MPENHLLHNALKDFLLKKNSTSFEQLYKLLSPVIFALCLRYLKNSNLAKEALQNTFITVFRKIDLYSGKGSFEGWVKKIAVNNCLAFLKESKKKES